MTDRPDLPGDLPAPAGPALDLPAPDGAPLDLPAPGSAPVDLAVDLPVPGEAVAPADAAVPEVTLGAGNPQDDPVVDPTVDSGAGSTTTPVPSDGGRAARRRASEELARSDADVSRRRVVIAAGVVVALLVAVVGGWWVVGRGSSGDADAAPTTSPSPTGPTQPTLLLQLTDKEGVGVGNALLSIGGGSLANMLTITPDTLVDVATGGTMPFGEVDRLPDADASANTLSDAIGVDVNGTWTMDKLAYSGLIDAVGGVVMDVNADVVEEQPDGSQKVLVGSGQHQLLQGPAAAAYATYLAEGEPEAARTARFVEVTRLALAKLPVEATKTEAILTGLGASARSTISPKDLAAFLVKMHEYVLADNVAYNSLPTVPADAGGATPGQRIDQTAASAMVDKYFADAKRKPGPNSKTRVLVQNGVGTPGLNTGARDLLVEAGYTFVNGGNAAVRGLAATQVIVPDRSTESLALGADIAKALKVPSTAVVVATEGQSIADVVVVLGRDFTPPVAG